MAFELLSRARNLARRLFKHRLRGFVDRSGFPFVLPHVRIVEGGVCLVDGTRRQVPADLLQALVLCDGTRTVKAISRATHVARERLMAEEDEGTLIVWPYRPARAEWHERNGIVLSPHL